MIVPCDIQGLQDAARRVVELLGAGSGSGRTVRRLSATVDYLLKERERQSQQIQQEWLSPAEKDSWMHEMQRIQGRLEAWRAVATAWRAVQGVSHRAYDAYFVPLELYCTLEEAFRIACNGEARNHETPSAGN